VQLDDAARQRQADAEAAERPIERLLGLDIAPVRSTIGEIVIETSIGVPSLYSEKSMLNWSRRRRSAASIGALSASGSASSASSGGRPHSTRARSRGTPV